MTHGVDADPACVFALFLVAGKDRQDQGESWRSSKALKRCGKNLRAVYSLRCDEDSGQLCGVNPGEENSYEKVPESCDSQS